MHHPWGFVPSRHMNSKGGEIFYRVDENRDRNRALRLEWVVKQHLDRAEDELGQLQGSGRLCVHPASVQGRTRGRGVSCFMECHKLLEHKKLSSRGVARSVSFSNYRAFQMTSTL